MIKTIILSPAKVWAQKSDSQGFFFMKLICVATLFVVWADVNKNYSVPGYTFESVLHSAVSVALVFFFSHLSAFYLSVILINEVLSVFIGFERKWSDTEFFVACSSVVMVLVDMVYTMWSDFFFVFMLNFYAFFIIWEVIRIRYPNILWSRINAVASVATVIYSLKFIMEIILKKMLM